MSYRRQRRYTFTNRTPLGIHDPNILLPGRVDLMKTVYPDEDRLSRVSPGMSLPVVPEEEEEAISVLSAVVHGETTKRRLSSLAELVIDMALIMQRKVAKRLAHDQTSEARRAGEQS